MDKPERTWPPVIAWWGDAHSTDEWTDVDDLDETPAMCCTRGFLVKETEKMLLVAGTISLDGQACCVMHIPKGMIDKVQVLNEEESRG